MDIDQLISDNIGLVYKQLHRFNRAYDADAFSYGLDGLWKAASTYDPNKQVAFSTYASVCIYNSIAMYMRELQQQARKSVTSLEASVSDGGDIVLSEVLSIDGTPETVYLKNELYETLWRNFDSIVDSTKNDIAVKILQMWRDSDFTATQMELAKAAGVSQAYVSRVLSAFKHKLKERMRDYL